MTLVWEITAGAESFVLKQRCCTEGWCSSCHCVSTSMSQPSLWNEHKWTPALQVTTTSPASAAQQTRGGLSCIRCQLFRRFFWWMLFRWHLNTFWSGLESFTLHDHLHQPQMGFPEWKQNIPEIADISHYLQVMDWAPLLCSLGQQLTHSSS